MQHGTNNLDHSVAGEPCASVGDLQPGPSGANGYLSVNERSLDTAEVVLAA